MPNALEVQLKHRLAAIMRRCRLEGVKFYPLLREAEVLENRERREIALRKLESEGIEEP